MTLSGGEVMASQHMDYVEEVCRKLHENGVSVFIDTSGYTDYENLKRILPYVDVFLYDIKVMDPEDHKKILSFIASLTSASTVYSLPANSRASVMHQSVQTPQAVHLERSNTILPSTMELAPCLHFATHRPQEVYWR